MNCRLTKSANSTKEIKKYAGEGPTVVLLDFGFKDNILAELLKRGCEVILAPWNTSAEEILAYKPDGIMLRNGPGDPTSVPEAIETIKQLIAQDNLPMFGICLGHQLISLASGATTYKLKFGHRGANHPVKDLETGKISLTSQNHGYAVDEESLSQTDLLATHRVGMTVRMKASNTKPNRSSRFNTTRKQRRDRTMPITCSIIL